MSDGEGWSLKVRSVGVAGSKGILCVFAWLVCGLF